MFKRNEVLNFELNSFYSIREILRFDLELDALFNFRKASKSILEQLKINLNFYLDHNNYERLLFFTAF